MAAPGCRKDLGNWDLRGARTGPEAETGAAAVIAGGEYDPHGAVGAEVAVVAVVAVGAVLDRGEENADDENDQNDGENERHGVAGPC